MADNKNIRDGDNAIFIGAADELSDSSFSPKITLLDGTGSAAGISPATVGVIGATNEAAAASDTATSGLNGLIKRLLQRITALQSKPTIGAVTSVAASVSSVAILAANTSRKGAAVLNDGSTDLRLLLASGTASATLFTVKLVPAAYYEVPFGYTGAIAGIWTGAPTGAARITEFT